MPDPIIEISQPQTFRAAYVDPLNTATMPDELEIPTPAAVDITDLSKYLPQTLGEIIIELRTKLARIASEREAVLQTIRADLAILRTLNQKRRFYNSLIHLIGAHITTIEPKEPKR
jgi:hypothetical protein